MLYNIHTEIMEDNVQIDDSILLTNLESKLGIAHNPDSINPADIQNIKVKLTESSGILPQETSSTKKTTKLELMDQIKHLCAIQNRPYDEVLLRRKNKDFLARYLGGMLNNGIDQLNGVSDQQIADDLENKSIYADDRPVMKTQEHIKYTAAHISTPQNISVDVAAKSLFQFNLMFSTIVEKISAETLKPNYGYEISGYTSALVGQRDDLMEIYRQIYKDHCTEIGKYLSPVNMLLVINFQACTQGIIKAEAMDIKKS